MFHAFSATFSSYFALFPRFRLSVSDFFALGWYVRKFFA